MPGRVATFPTCSTARSSSALPASSLVANTIPGTRIPGTLPMGRRQTKSSTRSSFTPIPRSSVASGAPLYVQVDAGKPGAVRRLANLEPMVGRRFHPDAFQVSGTAGSRADLRLEALFACSLYAEAAEHNVLGLVQIHQFIDPGGEERLEILALDVDPSLL